MYKRVTAVPTHGRDRASGFTLIEVMVALALLTFVATAVLALFIRGMQATSHLERTESAYAVAAEAMEKVRSISALELPTGTSGSFTTSGILVGRAQSDVQHVWDAAAAADPDNTAGSTPVWDLHPDLTKPPLVREAVQLVTDLDRSGISYRVTTLIGKCYRLALVDGVAQSCTKTDPGTTTAVRVFRVTVVVGWKPTSSGACGGALCVFRMSSLVDPHPESNWNLIPKPVANNDDYPVAMDDPSTLHEILANDVIGAVTSNPVTILTYPAFGTASLASGFTASGISKMGMLDYKPPTTSEGVSGIFSLIYMLRDAAGRTSEPGTVTFRVSPKAVNDDSASVPLGGSVDINVAANDRGTFGTPPVVKIVSGSGPSLGSASVVNGQIRYTAPTSGSSTTTSLKYTITDTSGLESAEATVTVNLSTVALPTAVDLAFTVKASATAVSTPLNMFGQTGMTGNNTTNKIVVVSGLTGGASPGTLTGTGSSDLSYTPGAIGVYTFTYKVQNVVGVSAIRTVTLTVSPVSLVANDDATSVDQSTWWHENKVEWDVGSNDVPPPAAGMTYTIVSHSGNACGPISIVESTGRVTFTAPNNTGSCTVQYTVSKTVGGTTLSATAHLVVTVNR